MYRLQVIDVRKYPFLADISSILKSRFGIDDIGLFLTHRQEYLELGLERVKNAIRLGSIPVEHIGSAEKEVLTYYTALILARLSRDKWLISRLALAEAERAARLLSTDDASVVETVGKRVGLQTIQYHDPPLREPIARVGTMIIYRSYEFSISFVEYVRVAYRLIGDPAWRPTNLPVLKGRIYMDKQRSVRLIKEAIMDYIIAQVMKLDVELVNDTLSRYVNTLEEFLSKYRRQRINQKGKMKLHQDVSGDAVIERSAFPPCMTELVAKLENGEHLSHHERFAIATFMLRIGASIDDVVDLFRNLPDFNERVTRYQVEHLAGLRGSMKKYYTYSCEKMKTLGICRADCNTRSPIQAYYRLLRRIGKDSES